MSKLINAIKATTEPVCTGTVKAVKATKSATVISVKAVKGASVTSAKATKGFVVNRKTNWVSRFQANEVRAANKATAKAEAKAIADGLITVING